MTDNSNALVRASRFLRAHLAAAATCSALVVIPCFWHRRIEAGDLPSHTYNAWLAQLIEQGRAPGLYTVHQWTNVLFDFLLLYSAKLFGFATGPKIAVAICVLVFFWGVFSFVAVASERAPWYLTPVIAMFAYGYVFSMGFFNFYLSVGLGCLALALFWNAGPVLWDWLVGATVLCFAVLAHPIGSLWCLGALAYVLLRRKLPLFWGLGVPVAVIAMAFAAHFYLAHLSNVTTLEIDWRERAFYFFNGSDQLVVFTARTRWFATACVTIAGSWLAYESLEWRHYLEGRKRLALFAELYFLSFCIACLSPQNIRTGSEQSWMGLLVNRVTIFVAIFALCALSSLIPRKWTTTALMACALAYFTVLYQDTAVINRLELHAEQVTENLPYGTRVVPTIAAAPGSRISFIEHVVDRACIARCFIYSSYEPSSAQFRIRVNERSSVATDSAMDAQAMEGGDYVVKQVDLPLLNIYQCGADDSTTLCSRELHVGDTTAPQPEDDSPP
jgi:hypothetical protein